MLVSDVNLYPVQYLLMKLKSDINMMKNLQSSGFAGCGGHEACRILANGYRGNYGGTVRCFTLSYRNILSRGWSSVP